MLRFLTTLIDATISDLRQCYARKPYKMEIVNSKSDICSFAKFAGLFGLDAFFLLVAWFQGPLRKLMLHAKPPACASFVLRLIR